MEVFYNHETTSFRACWARILTSLNIVVFFFTVILNIWSFQRLNSCNKTTLLPTDSRQQRVLKSHYPLIDLAQYSPKRFDADLGAPSVYKGPPRPQLDDAWKRLVDQPMLLVNNETLQSFDPTSKPSKGVNGHYYATVEVYHQLHCLDITRKFIWRQNYQHVDTFQDPPDMVWEHVDHCIDLLRQVLMCNGDIGLVFYTDVGKLKPVPRFSTTHMCRDFAAITEWVNKHDSELGIYAENDVN
ncbi:hypothetical protein EJ05DRAFT_506871 [Pseudovirgaria hyperparasitica]|uniref:Tat pathway signal sequence n=1 Tax=Pseudovirgaria hyperparasitica TaxID=470096 RepID=A0A6A6WM98_9PEZI|nr:uncharacterized protein EJ05DRAFT_506871 [Pseudovirgaria hyperparasitica]KAF2763256.1 hypothetical protein EJ05DRAFT_506871 [Pseudovirgaria hyperparasitica]